MEDFPHVGALCRTIREEYKVRGTQERLTLKAIAEACFCDVAALSRFENYGTLGSDISDCYVRTVCEQLALDPRHGQGLQDFLFRLFRASRRREDHEAVISNFSFGHITSERELVAQLRNEKSPSFIRDQLWFVHAFNGPILRLFNLDLDNTREFLNNWEAWHVIATKYHPDSPVRNAHPEKNRHTYFPPACQRFFELSSIPFLFTTQVRELLRRLQLNVDFEKLWKSIVTFTQYYPSELERTITFRDLGGNVRQIETTIYERPLGRVEIMPGQFMEYFQVVWRTKQEDSISESVFREITSASAGGNVIFASEYIPDYSDWAFTISST